jgi:hypothetical protein
MTTLSVPGCGPWLASCFGRQAASAHVFCQFAGDDFGDSDVAVGELQFAARMISQVWKTSAGI